MAKFVESRFWKKVNKTEYCWEWMGSRHPDGYGYIIYNGFLARAHRVSWEIHFGTIPEGMIICHTCDNRGCVNPTHLFIGNQSDNVKDMINKGRSPCIGHGGETNVKAKLTQQDVDNIRILISEGYTNKYISNKYNVAPHTISYIRHGKSWTRVI
jgi:hypothetical protein